MKRARVMAIVAGTVAAWGVLLAGAANSVAVVVTAGIVPALNSWGSAIEVPGLAALNVAGRAEVLSVSCSPAGDCEAGGSYWDRHRDLQGFVVSEENGAWGSATDVPGLKALN